MPFPAAKLLPPAPPARLVDRPRLHELIERGTTGLVTLVSAHAGSGKTVLLSSWAAEAEPRRVAWLGLDRDDNWSPRFWLGVERALAGTGALDGTSANPGEARLALQIADRLEGRDEPVVLVLDDFHEIESPIVQRELQTLIDRSPSGLRLVLSTRADPGLRLQRLRLTDDLVEIRAAELAFTLDECGEALEPFATDLAEGDVQALCDRTEGWAAGIRLAALSLASESDRAGFLRRFAGDDRAVADYLLNEILDRQPDRLREFLLRTSVPDTISAELADALTGRRDGGRVLAELAAANFLVSGYVGSEVRYRYHGLLLEFLRAQLRRTRPHDLGLLQRLSARWHWTAHEPVPAFRDALAGGDWDLADEIAADAWHAVGYEAAGEEHDALLQLPPEATEGRPSLCVLSAFASLASGDRQEAERRLAAADESLDAVEAFGGERVLRLQAGAALAQLDGDYELLEAIASGLVEAPAGQRLRRDDPHRSPGRIRARASRRRKIRARGAGRGGRTAGSCARPLPARRSPDDGGERARRAGAAGGRPRPPPARRRSWRPTRSRTQSWAARLSVHRSSARSSRSAGRTSSGTTSPQPSTISIAPRPPPTSPVIAGDGSRPPHCCRSPAALEARARQEPPWPSCAAGRSTSTGGGRRRRWLRSWRRRRRGCSPRAATWRRRTPRSTARRPRSARHRRSHCSAPGSRSPRASPRPRSRSSSADRRTSWTPSASGSRPAC